MDEAIDSQAEGGIHILKGGEIYKVEKPTNNLQVG